MNKADLEGITGREIDQNKLAAMNLAVALEGLDAVDECLHELLDVQAGLDLVLKMHRNICAGEEGAFLNVLGILSSTLKDRIERGMETIP